MSCSFIRKRNKYENVDAIIFPAEFTMKKFLDSSFFPGEKLFLNPTFIDCRKIIPTYKHQNYVLCPGRFSEEKGFLFVFKSLEYLRDLPVTIVITGDISESPPMVIEVINELKIEEKVRFTGFLDSEKYENIIKDCMCIACPAIWYENMPNVIIEAYAHGKPVIASNLGSLPQIVKNEYTGLLFEPKSSFEIAACIRKLYEDSSLYIKLAMNARLFCEEEFSPIKHWNTFLEIFSIIKNREKECD